MMKLWEQCERCELTYSVIAEVKGQLERLCTDCFEAVKNEWPETVIEILRRMVK